MVIGILGESCTGKSTLANAIQEALQAEIISGKDYLRFAKNENDALLAFQEKLQTSVHGNPIIYVITEKEQIAFLPKEAFRICMRADLKTIQERFAKRMHSSKLPEPIAMMLERKHGCFDEVPCNLTVMSEQPLSESMDTVLAALDTFHTSSL